MSVKVVLENAKVQLEAQKKRIVAEAHDKKYAELKPSLDEYTKLKAQEKAEAEASLNASYQKAIASKEAEIEAQANLYANSEVAIIDNQISQLEEMIKNAQN